MASDPDLVARLGQVLAAWPELVPKRMFGGTCFTLNGNMCVGVHERSLILRVGEERTAVLLREPHVRPMDLTGKVMRGWATVLPEAIGRDEDLLRYAALARDFVLTLPPKLEGTGGMRPRKKPARG